jgi:hypothetical protein
MEFVEVISIDDINMIMRQTNYSKEEATKKLSEYNCNTMKVIKEYLEIEEKKEVKIPENQLRIKKIRDILKDTKPLESTLESSPIQSSPTSKSTQ